MKLQLANCRCVGAMLSVGGKARFDEAALVVREANEDFCLRIDSYISEEVSGDLYTKEQWTALVRDGQASERDDLAEVKLFSGAILWAFRPEFDDRNSAIDDLKSSSALLSPPIAISVGAGKQELWCLVRRPFANNLRNNWKEKALERTEERARIGRWSQALDSCLQAYALATELDARILSRLALCYEMQNRKERANGYLDLAERSKGKEFRAEVEAYLESWRTELRSLGSPHLGIRKGVWYKEQHAHLLDGQIALVDTKRAA